MINKAVQFSTILALTAGCSAIADTRTSDVEWVASFEAELSARMSTAGVPGLAVALVERDRTVFQGGYGFADIDTDRRVSARTVFHIASISKIVLGTALMMLHEDGRFKLDDSISEFLGFPVRNPYFPGSAITFRQIFTHTSSISDDNYGETDETFFTPGDPELPLREFLAEYLQPGGEWYTPSGSFYSHEPGSEWSYSNVGMALAGYVVQELSGDPLNIFTQFRIFGPLNIESAGWMLKDVDRTRLATPYDFENGELKSLGHVGYPDWPAGLLRISIEDLASFLKIYTDGGLVSGERILQEGTVEEMLNSRLYKTNEGEEQHQGLFWIGYPEKGKIRMGHGGSDPGASAMIAFSEGHTKAVIVVSNVSRTEAVTDLQDWVVDEFLDFPCGSDNAN